MRTTNIYKQIFSKWIPNKSSKQPSRSQVPNGTLTFLVKRNVKQHLLAGKAYMEQKRFQDAIKEYSNALKIDPKSPLCHFHLAYALHEDGQTEPATRHYEKAIELEPTCSLFIETLARLKFETLEYEEATQLFYRASMAGSIQPLSLGLWGRALYEQGFYEDSIHTFEQLLQRCDTREVVIGTLFWQIRASIKLGRMAAARKLTLRILRQKEVDCNFLNELGESFIEARCLSIARQIFEKLAIDKEEFLLARLRLEDIRSLEKEIDKILPKLFDGDEERLLHKIHALREFGDDKISKALLSLINAPSAPVREGIIRYQTTFGYDVASHILPLLKDDTTYVREAAYEYFDKLDQKKYLCDMKDGLNDSSLFIRKIVTQFLGRYGTFESAPLLEMAYDCPENKEIRKIIKESIVSIKRRYQENIDSLYKVSAIPIEIREIGSSSFSFKYCFVLTLQILFILYFLYFVFAKL